MKNFFSDNDFVNVMSAHAYETIELLFEKGMFFSILVNISEVTFEPELPQDLKENFKPITLFSLAGYTYESAEITEDSLIFEAGFGSENIGSLVTVPLHSTIQILVEDTPIFINLSRKLDSKKIKSRVERSKNIFLSNPENQKLLKRRRKN